MSSNNDGFLGFRYSFVSTAEHAFVSLSFVVQLSAIAELFWIMQI